MKRLPTLLLLLSLFATAAFGQITDERELKTIAQSLLDAVAQGDTMVWERSLHRDFVLTDETGNLVTRPAMLSYLRTLPRGQSDRLRLGTTVVRRVGNVAVVHHRDLEHADVAGQTIDAEYQTTDTYVKVGGRWKLLASHVMALPRPRKAISIDTAKLRDLEGTYELQPGVTYSVRLENGRLVGQRGGNGPETLLPMSADMFFPEGTVRGEKLFTRDADGRIVALVDRRDNIDLVWKRVPRE